jgi:hypothetical protein
LRISSVIRYFTIIKVNDDEEGMREGIEDEIEDGVRGGIEDERENGVHDSQVS